MMYFEIFMSVFLSGVFYLVFLLFAKRHGNMILGITLPAENFESKEVLDFVRDYKKILNLTSLVMFILLVGVGFIFKDTWSLPIVLIIFFIAMFFMWRVGVKYMNLLYDYKKANNLVVGSQKKITIDTVASSMQGKQTISVWWYLIPTAISSIPFIRSLTSERFNQVIPLYVSLLPFVLSGIFYLTSLTLKRSKTKVISKDSNINILANKVYQKGWSFAFFATALITSSWMSLMMNLTYINPASNLFQVILVIMFLFSIIGIFVGAQLKIGKQLEEIEVLSKESKLLFDEDVYWLKGYYDNPNDKRILVDERVGMGMTLNMGNVYGKIIASVIYTLLAILLIGLFGTFYMVEKSSFNLYQQGDTFYTEAPFYKTSFNENEIVNVRLINDLPAGSRTNGFGLPSIDLGNYFLHGYGKSKVYVYRNKPPFVIIELKEKTVLINGKTEEETLRIYERVRGHANNY